jgi:hypothetical protein
VPSRLVWPLGLALTGAALVALPHLLSFSQREIAVFLLINVLLVASYRLLTLTGEWSGQQDGAAAGRRRDSGADLGPPDAGDSDAHLPRRAVRAHRQRR